MLISFFYFKIMNNNNYDPFKYIPYDMYMYRHRKEMTRVEQESGANKYNNMTDDTGICDCIQKQEQ